MIEILRDCDLEKVKKAKETLSVSLIKMNYKKGEGTTQCWGKFKNYNIKKEKDMYILETEFKCWHMLASTLKDSHNERVSKDFLEKMKEQIKEFNILSYNEHDYSNPPIARIIDADILTLEEESYLFGDLVAYTAKNVGNKVFNQKIVIEKFEEMSISFDRNFEIDSDLKEMVKNFTNGAKNIKVGRTIKKSIEFTPEIIINYCVGAIAAGFFNAIGADLWEKIKEIRVKALKKYPNQEIHLILNESKILPNGEKVLFKTINIEKESYREIELEEITTFLGNQTKEIIKNKSNEILIVNIVKNGKIEFAYSLDMYGNICKVGNIEMYEKILNDSNIKI